ncbi:hypothetical protein ACFYSI_13240 [Staphylococcus xylosus]|uniref:hypothetical protein n=1 Tax=Staphylococcus xylosus TaxID=1288 RepID=UPI0036C9A4E2
MLDDFIRRNKVELINIILCVLIIATEICAMTIIGFEWQLLMILLPFPILIVGNILAIFIKKKNISIMVNIMKIIFPLLVLQIGLITILKIITDTTIIEVTNRAETWFDFITITSMTASILAIILILILAFSKVEDNNLKLKEFNKDE